MFMGEPILKYDLHLHLYGCLTPEDISDLGQDIWHLRRDRLEAYSARYDQAFGRRPDYESYWSEQDSDNRNPNNIARDFLCTTPATFQQFEAKFGLPIALFPISSARDDLRVLQRVMTRHRAEGRHHVEYRVVYPPASVPSSYSLMIHLNGLCAAMDRFDLESGGVFEPRLALSLSREPTLAMDQYKEIKSWQESTPSKWKRVLTALDFSGYEEDFTADGLEAVARRLHIDNAATPKDALALLIHAGETMEKISVPDGVRRIEAAAKMGAHRIGHAVAMGAPCDEATRLFQDRTRAWIATQTSCVIECCLTSNLMLAGVGNLQSHPVRQFLADGLRVCFATDDPGVFGTDSRQEAAKAISLIGNNQFEKTNLETPNWRSEILCGRF